MSLAHSLLRVLLPLAFVGSLAAQTIVVSNLSESNDGDSGAYYDPGFPPMYPATNRWQANSFTTSTSLLQLDGIIFKSAYSESVTPLTVKLFSDNVGAPGSALATLGSAVDVGDGYYKFSPTSTLTLDSNTTYWWVASLTAATSTSFRIPVTYSVNETSVYGWTIGNRFAQSTNGGASWNVVGIDLVNQFSVSAVSAVPEPSTWALLLGLAALGSVVAHRRRR